MLMTKATSIRNQTHKEISGILSFIQRFLRDTASDKTSHRLREISYKAYIWFKTKQNKTRSLHIYGKYKELLKFNNEKKSAQFLKLDKKSEETRLQKYTSEK